MMVAVSSGVASTEDTVQTSISEQVVECSACDCLPYHAVFQAVKQEGFCCYRPNCTVTCAPAATCVPAGGDCCRATPLPTASSSRPASWAASTAPRTVLPTNDGTSMPPCSTSRTTVPVAGNVWGAEAISGFLVCAWPDWLGAAGAGSLCRIAASTTCPSAWVVAGEGARATMESPSTSAVSSGSPG